MEQNSIQGAIRENLRILKWRRRVSSGALAKAAGISLGAMNDRLGGRARFQIEEACAFAAVFDVSLEQLLQPIHPPAA